MGHYDDFYEAANADRDKKFHERLDRRNKLIKIIKKKYPEVMELLELAYEEKHLV